MNVNLEYLKIFYYVAKLEGITLAAKELSVSQPAVSQAMKQLEHILNAKLFLRTRKGIRLTAEGQVFYDYVARGYEAFEEGERKLTQMLNLDFGEIRIGASDMTLQFYLLPYLEQFHELYPRIKVRVTNAPTPETIRYLEEGKIDFGVVSTPFLQNETMQSIEVKEIEDVFVAGRKFISYKNKTLDLDELEKMPLICLEKNTSTRKYMDGFLLENHVKLNPEFELATSDMIVQFALRNLGIGMVMKEFAEESIDSGKLFLLRFNKMIPKRNFCIVTDKNKTLSTSAQKLLQLIQTDRARNWTDREDESNLICKQSRKVSEHEKRK